MFIIHKVRCSKLPLELMSQKQKTSSSLHNFLCNLGNYYLTESTLLMNEPRNLEDREERLLPSAEAAPYTKKPCFSFHSDCDSMVGGYESDPMSPQFIGASKVDYVVVSIR